MRLRHFCTLGSLATIITIACASGSGEDPPGNGKGGSNSAGQANKGGSSSGGSSNGGNASGGSNNGLGGSTFGGSSSGGSGFGGSSSGGSSAGSNSAGGSTAGTGSGGTNNQGGNQSAGGRSMAGGTTSGGSNGNGGNNNQAGNSQKGGTTGSGGSMNRGGQGNGGNMSRGGQGNGGSGQGGTTTGAGGAGKGGSQGQGGSTQQCSPPSGGSQGYTTRFWDCCKPSCSWPGNVPQGKNPVKSCNQQNQSTGSSTASACSGGGGAYACWDMAPWAVSDTLAYGYAAFNGSQCGQCYELKFTGQSNSVSNDPGSAALCGKTMIVQVINIGNITQGQFDLMIPGGGVGQFNACTQQWGVSGSALGEQYGGIQLTCQKQSNDWNTRKSCTTTACNNLFKNSNESNLLAGCKWGVDWLQAADNPKVSYRQVSCPSELTSKSGLQ